MVAICKSITIKSVDEYDGGSELDCLGQIESGDETKEGNRNLTRVSIGE